MLPPVAPKVWKISDLQSDLSAQEWAQRPVTQTNLRDAIASLTTATSFNVRNYSTPVALDDTLAFAAAVLDAKATGGVGAEVTWTGNLGISDTINVDAYRITIKGRGKGYASTITFNPSTAKPLFKVQMANPAAIIAQCAFSDFALIGQGTQQKIGFDIWDGSDISISRIICTVGWTGNSGSGATPSMFLRTNGRELVRGRDLTAFTERPFHFRVNPNSNATETTDHFKFQELYLNSLVATEACILIDANCAPTNLVIKDFALIGGKYGIDYTAGGTTGTAGYMVDIGPGRYEQSMDATGYAVRWQGQISQNVSFHSFHCGGGNNNGGVLIRNTSRVLFENSMHTGVAGSVAFDITTCDEVWRINSFSQAGGACVFTGLEEVISYPQANSTAPAPNSAYYCSVALNAIRAIKVGGTYKYSYHGPVANGATFGLPLLTVGNGLKVATCWVEAYSAVGPIQEGGLARVDATGVIIRSGSANFVTTNTAGKLCLFFNTSGNPVVIVNNTGQQISLTVDITAVYT